MAAVAAEALRQGCRSLEWGVHKANTGALEFYRRIGASGHDVLIMGLDADHLRELTGLAAPPRPS
jgi:hypothetical protein